MVKTWVGVLTAVMAAVSISSCALPTARAPIVPSAVRAVVVEDAVLYEKLEQENGKYEPKNRITIPSDKDAELAATVTRLFRKELAAVGFSVVPNDADKNALRLKISINRPPFWQSGLIFPPHNRFLVQVFQEDRLITDYYFVISDPYWLFKKETVLQGGIELASSNLANLLLRR